MADNNYGGIISLDQLQKSRRGAEKTYDVPMLELLTLLAKNPGVIFNTLKVARADWKDADSFRNERQRIGAMIRSHVDHLVDTKELPDGTKIGIDWHPELSVPQVHRKDLS